jgi:hypothetical protein
MTVVHSGEKTPARLEGRQVLRGEIVIELPLLGYGCFLHVFDDGGGEGGGA